MFILASSEACGLISETTVNFIASLIKAIKYLVPILLIVMGSLDFVKATFSQKDDELKDAKTKFINKLVAGIAVFFVFSFVTWLVNLLAENFGIKSLECVNSFLSGSYKESDIDDMSGNKFEQCQKNCEEKSGGNATGYNECIKTCGTPNTTTKKETTSVTDSPLQQVARCHSQEFYTRITCANESDQKSCGQQKYEECKGDKEKVMIIDKKKGIQNNPGSIKSCYTFNDDLDAILDEIIRTHCSAAKDKKICGQKILGSQLAQCYE